MNVRRVEPIPLLLQKEERKHRDSEQYRLFWETDNRQVSARLLDVIG